MKRNLELVKLILNKLEDKESPIEWLNNDIFEGFSEETVSYHIKILDQARYIEAQNHSSMGSFNWAAINLTWEGHEFLDALRNDTIMLKVKDKFGKELSNIPFEVLKSGLCELTKMLLVGGIS